MGDNAGTGTTWRWDGAGWNNPHSPGAVGILRGVQMLDANTALAIGDGDKRTRWNGVSWTPEGGAVIATTDWRAVFMVSPSDQWMVGKPAVATSPSSIAHWTPSAWTPIAVPNVPTTGSLNSIFMLPGGTDGWAVGDGGAIIRWNSFQWNSVANPTNLQLYGVWLASSGDGWAVGKSGGIFSWNGQFWNLYQTLPSGADLFAVHGDTTNDVWAVGQDLDGAGPNPPAVVHWDGASWTAVQCRRTYRCNPPHGLRRFTIFRNGRRRNRCCKPSDHQMGWNNLGSNPILNASRSHCQLHLDAGNHRRFRRRIERSH